MPFVISDESSHFVFNPFAQIPGYYIPIISILQEG